MRQAYFNENFRFRLSESYIDNLVLGRRNLHSRREVEFIIGMQVRWFCFFREKLWNSTVTRVLYSLGLYSFHGLPKPRRSLVKLVIIYRRERGVFKNTITCQFVTRIWLLSFGYVRSAILELSNDGFNKHTSNAY